MMKLKQFLKLIQNENMKSFLRIKTLVMCIILIITVVITGIVMNSTEKQPKDYKEDLKKQILKLETENTKLQNKMVNEKDKTNRELNKSMLKLNSDELVIYKYAYDNDIAYNYYTNWKFVKSASWITILIMLFIILKASDSIPLEYSNGTIKQLLIRPYKRWKILLSKFLSLIFESLVFYTLLFLATFILGSIFFGFKGASYDILLKNGLPVKVSILTYCLEVYLCDFAKIIVLISLALMISILLKNSSASVAITLVLLFSGSLATQFLGKYSFAKFLIFPNLSLKQYLPGGAIPIKGLTMEFSLVVILIYFAVFTAISFRIFTKRDVI